MPKLHSEPGLFWTETSAHRIEPSTTHNLLRKPAVGHQAPDDCSIPSSKVTEGHLHRIVLEKAPRRDFRKGMWTGLLGWLATLLCFLLVVLVMASSTRPKRGGQGARLKELLRRALVSRDPCEALADAAKRGGVRVIAADFDLTMITLHSGGNTSNTSGNPIFTSLSSDFNAFAAAANSRGIVIAVVTFGDPNAIGGRPGRIAGEPLVRRVLEESGASFKVEGVFPFYPPLYHSPVAYRALGLKQPMPYNKSFHIEKLRAQFGVSKEEVLLIDDDAKNCEAFATEGGVSLRVGGEQGFDLSQLEVF